MKCQPMIKKLVQNPPPPGWAPELSTMIASATAKALAEEVVNAIPPTGVRGNKGPPPSSDSHSRGEGVGHVGQCIIFRGAARSKTSAGRGTDRKTKTK